MNVLLIVETFVAFMLALVLHDWGHSFAATLLGDDSLASDGLISPNPVRHLAPVGTFVAVILSFISYAGLGWGRPARVDSSRIRGGPDFGAVLVAIAGPFFNVGFGLLILVGTSFIPGFQRLPAFVDSLSGPCPIYTGGYFGQSLQHCLVHAQPGYLLRIEQFLIVLSITNLVIALVNILPLHPLDGYRVLYALLPSNAAMRLRRWEPYMEGILLIIFLVVPFILELAGISGFNPAAIFTNLAAAIASQVAGPAVVLTMQLL
ncbi:MAG TPA: site-2 protease family protein [Ktedonobacterales bacterium]|jgi:Zn-dependent protease